MKIILVDETLPRSNNNDNDSADNAFFYTIVIAKRRSLDYSVLLLPRKEDLSGYRGYARMRGGGGVLVGAKLLSN